MCVDHFTISSYAHVNIKRFNLMDEVEAFFCVVVGKHGSVVLSVSEGLISFL